MGNLEIEIKAGNYYQSKQAMKHIELGMVLLCQSVRWVDDAPHTIIMRAHPSVYPHVKEHRFLLDDFLAKFKVVESPEKMRDDEVRALQGEISDKQRYLASAQEDPSIMAKHILPALKAWEEEHKFSEQDTTPTNFDDLLESSPNALAVAQAKVKLERTGEEAKQTAKWISERVEEIGELVQSLVPYYQERAAAVLAATEDTQRYIATLTSGIESLNLFTGEKVEVVTHRSGKSAPETLPLTVYQSKLHMDEELCVYMDIDDHFDYHNTEDFFDTLLREPGLVDQIFPSERSIVCMDVTKEEKNYGHAIDNYYGNKINKEVFLLVRDGENLYQVRSPVESHLMSDRLFPSEKEINDIFREKNWGLEAEEIKYMDTRYTDKLQIHEDVALHYKRFLVLLAGLDNRLSLFGKFHPPINPLKFIGYEFQSAYVRFLYTDAHDSKQLKGETKLDVWKWMESQNKNLKEGSRVVCRWNYLLTHSNCSYCFSYRGGWYQTKEPVKNVEVKTVYMHDGHPTVDVEVSVGDKTRKAKVYLDASTEDYPYFLVLDQVTVEDLNYYVYTRSARRDFAKNMLTLKTGLKFLKSDTEGQDGGTNHPAVVEWRRQNKWAAFKGKKAEAFKKTWAECLQRIPEFENAQPLKMTTEGGKFYIYIASAEQNNWLLPYEWCCRHEILKTGLGPATMANNKRSYTETTLYEWPAWADFSKLASVFQSPEQKEEAQRMLDHVDSELDQFSLKHIRTNWESIFEEWRRERNDLTYSKKGNGVAIVMCSVVVGFALDKTYYVNNPPVVNHITTLHLATDLCDLLWVAGTEEQRSRLEKAYANIYKYKSEAYERIRKTKLEFSLFFVGGFKRKINGWYSPEYSFLPAEFNYKKALKAVCKNEDNDLVMASWVEKFSQLMKEWAQLR